ncbi:MAG: radical SAM protein, partial [Desulfofundulus sp.]
MLSAILQHGKGYHEMGPIRPPSEGKDRSLLVRVTRNCPWNRCEFCRTYKNKTYSLRGVEEIKADIDTVKALAGEIKAVSWRFGFRGVIGQEAVGAFINENPALYSRAYNNSEIVERRLESLFNVVQWLSSGARTVFLQDANAPQIRTADLVEILCYLKESFPTIERITSYARSKTIARKSPEDLKRLREAGLTRLHIGLESGCDEVLAFIKKGATAAEHVLAGQKTRGAGIELSEYYMPGLGGKKWSRKHALESARVLNEIDPDFIRLRTL